MDEQDLGSLLDTVNFLSKIWTLEWPGCTTLERASPGTPEPQAGSCLAQDPPVLSHASSLPLPYQLALPPPPPPLELGLPFVLFPQGLEK